MEKYPKELKGVIEKRGTSIGWTETGSGRLTYLKVRVFGWKQDYLWEWRQGVKGKPGDTGKMVWDGRVWEWEPDGGRMEKVPKGRIPFSDAYNPTVTALTRKV